MSANEPTTEGEEVPPTVVTNDNNEPTADTTAATTAATEEGENNENANVSSASATASAAAAASSSAPRKEATWTFGEPDYSWLDGDVVRLDALVTSAWYGPADNSSQPADVTEVIRALQAKERYIFQNGVHEFVGDPFPGQVKRFAVKYDADSLAASKTDVFTVGRKPKSLFMALVCVNPFHEVREYSGVDADAEAEQEEDNKSEPKEGLAAEIAEDMKEMKSKMKSISKDLHGPHIPEEGLLKGYTKTAYNPATNLHDDDFLKPTKNALGITNKKAPNNFQKMIELLLRLKTRGLTVLPPDVLEEGEAPEDMAWNHFAGHRLNEEKMFLSPDKDECYFKIHANRDILLEFAEHQALTLRTNPYSFGGGGGMIYTHELDAELTTSVQDFMKHYEIPQADAYCQGKIDKEASVPGQPDVHKGFGFCVEVPQKMRLLVRLLREGWMFGGCGLQLSEMLTKSAFLINYFPIHNKTYQQEYKLDQWGGLCYCCACCDTGTCACCSDHELALIHYFGEEIAIYFSWISQYCQQLILPAIIGCIAGGVEFAGYAPDIVGGGYSIFMIVWGVWWIRKWQRAENRYAIRWGQDVEAREELVRDEYEYDKKREVDVRAIYTMDFEVPLTMQRLPDGTMVELFFPSSTRSCRRYGVSYPILAIFAAGMVAALFFTEDYRYNHSKDTTVAVGASIVSVLITTICTKISSVLIELMNDFENCRTDTEYNNESVMKSYAFTFVSTYFAAIALFVWPGYDPNDRVYQLRVQMAIQLVMMPMVNNLSEILLPRFMTSLQKRTDTLGGTCAALCSYFCCCCTCSECCLACNYDEKQVGSPANNREEQGQELWNQAQKQKYCTTTDDVLEITIQFGYIMLFCSVFPFGAAAALFYNVLEIRVDAYKLIHEFQRPIARTSTGLGSWNDIFWLVAGLALISNTYYVTVIGAAVTQLKLGSSLADRLKAFTALQYIITFMMLVLAAIRGQESPTVKKSMVKQQLLRDRAIQEFVKKRLALTVDEMKKKQEEAAESIQKSGEEEETCCGCC